MIVEMMCPDPSGSRVCVPLAGSMWDGCPIVDEIGWIALHAVAVGWIDVGWLPRCRCHRPWAVSKPRSSSGTRSRGLIDV